MSTDLARQVPQTIIDPDTGEEILRSDTEKVADLLRRLKQYLAQWDEAKTWCQTAIIEAADERSEWTFDVPGVGKVKVDPPSKAAIRWDMDELHKLEALLPPERYAELVVQTVSEKAQTIQLQTLARQAGPDSEVGRIITRAEQRNPASRYVSVPK